MGIPVFGVGTVHHLAFPNTRLNLLRQALDVGFRAFDVAPAYGNGLNEFELGRALVGVHSEVRITTKFGIPIDLFGERHPTLAFVIRAMRRLSRRDYGQEYSQRDFSPDGMVRSLEGSLRRLRRDYVDDFMIHEPLGVFGADELLALHDAADRLRNQGKIRRWGVAGPFQSVLPFQDDLRIDVIQAPLEDVVKMGPSGVKHRIAYNVYKAFRSAPNAGEENFTSFAKRQTKEMGMDLIVTTRRPQTLAGFRSLFE